MRALCRLPVVLAVLLCSAAQAANLPQLVVAQYGTGQYRSVQAAVDAAPAGGAVLRIKSGTYREKLQIAPNTSGIPKRLAKGCAQEKA